MGEVLLDALLDSLKLFPFLFLIYVLIEILENRTNISRNHNVLRGNLAPLLGAATGLVPQCGFSVMAAKLYDRKLIRTGTVLAVFLATSDEAFILLLADGTKAAWVVPMIAAKFVIAVGIGYLANALFRKETLAELSENEEIHGTACGHDHEEESKFKSYFLHPLLHSLEIFVYILAVNIIFGLVIHFVGEDKLEAFLQKGVWYQPLVAAAVGLIPNCASSVVITEAFIDGYIAFGSCVAGLCANAGLGFVVLFRNVRKWKRNLALMLAVYVIGVGFGYLLNAVLPLF
ncbi:MAG TPA: arsenic efflux protein [Candidatus Borkfalkia excrementavium]|uniref:Arsenic efflux protein n=1 Tax=Candidatus Borkfalkia excrementavium TaxID=2838505 RepID=A0A9D2CGE3_9FIRM|nr:arsenic efflux protein [Candidatus Borkfalkia excrementavium]